MIESRHRQLLRSRLTVAFGLGVVLFGTSCTTTEKYTGAGAALGAVAGAVVAKQMGYDPAKGALIGGGLGALGGAGVGHMVNEKRQKYASAQDFLDNEIVETRTARLSLESENRRLTAECDSIERERLLLTSQYGDLAEQRAAQNSLLERATKELAASKTQQKKIADALEFEREGVLKNDEVLGESAKPQLEAEVAALEAQKAQLDEQVKRLEKINSDLSQS